MPRFSNNQKAITGIVAALLFGSVFCFAFAYIMVDVTDIPDQPTTSANEERAAEILFHEVADYPKKQLSLMKIQANQPAISSYAATSKKTLPRPTSSPLTTPKTSTNMKTAR